MLVKRLKLINFMSHRDTDVELPETGIILITGENGSGKSSFYEGVAYGCFGKTVRGTNPWSSKTGKVVVEADDVLVSRKNSSGKVSFSWKQKDESAKDYATKTKGRQALEELISTFDIWKKTHVFSISDIAGFTKAPDSERKRFLETLLDLEKFDVALKKCRTELASKRKALDAFSRKVDIETALKEKAEEILVETSKKALEGKLRSLSDIVSQKERLLVSLDIYSKDIVYREDNIRVYGKNIGIYNMKLGTLNAKRQAAKEKASSIINSKYCDSCKRKISKKDAEELAEPLRDEVEKLSAEIVKTQQRIEAATAARDKLLKEEKFSKMRIRTLEDKAQALDYEIKEVKNYLSRKDSLQSDIDSHEETIAELSKKMSTIEEEILVLEQAEKVLGLRGVRSKLLGSLLQGIQDLTNKYLLDLCSNDPISVELLSYKETKTGAVSDCIDIKVHGAGGGHGYKGASAGERRRIDVALLLALADITGKADQCGTLWFDEVMDSLDEAGCAAVVEILSGFAENRNVVLISHSSSVINELKVAKHIKVNNGTIS